MIAKRGAAAYAHYPTLRIQPGNLRNALSEAIDGVGLMTDDWRIALKDNARLATEFVAQGTPLHPYRTIAPVLVGNVHQAAAFLLEECRPADPVGIERAGETAPSYSDFLRLGAAVRSFLDALIQTTYQLSTFNGLQLNYKFLQSLLSFASVAPPALQTNIISPDVQAALNAYFELPPKDRKNSNFTKAAYDQFPQRLDVAADLAALPDWQRNNLKLIFSFCSDFVHSGYISVLALEEPGSSIIMGGDGDAFVARAENFAELKQRLLEACAGAYADLLLPILHLAVARTLAGDVPADWLATLDSHRATIGRVRATLDRQLIEPVRKSFFISGDTAHISRVCGGHVELAPPYHEWDRYCGACGARIVLLELPDEVDYVISDFGAGDVLGGDAPKMALLDPALHAKLERIVANHKPPRDSEAVNFVQIIDLDLCDETTLAVPSQITAAPAKGIAAELRVFVATKSLSRCATVRIQCNCGRDVDYAVTTATLVCQCGSCNRKIGLIGVSGTGDRVGMRNPDGSDGFAPIQARNRFAVPGVATNAPFS